VLSGRGLCDGLITHPEESYRLWCVVVCDLGTSRMRLLKLIKDCKCRIEEEIQGGSNMTGTNCDLFTHNQSRSYLNHLVHAVLSD
jgi:hypothetical protein